MCRCAMCRCAMYGCGFVVYYTISIDISQKRCLGSCGGNCTKAKGRSASQKDPLTSLGYIWIYWNLQTAK
jgi:hypothetical protein